MSGTNVKGLRFAIYEMKLAGHPIPLPKMESLSTARNLSEIIITPTLFTASQFVMLREEFKKNGKRDQERAITAALKRMETRNSHWIEKYFSLIAFDLTVEYGASPGRPLRILGITTILFSFAYILALRRIGGSGIGLSGQKNGSVEI